MIGAFLGAFLIDLLQQSLLRWVEVSEFWRDAMLGMLILVAVVADRPVIMNRLRRWWGAHQPERTTQSRRPTSSREALAMRASAEAPAGLGRAAAASSCSSIVALQRRPDARATCSLDNLINLFQLSIEKIIVALVMTFVIINGEIDLSVASIMGLSACVAGLPLARGHARGAGDRDRAPGRRRCAALFNGFFVALVGLPSLVVTLAA